MTAAGDDSSWERIAIPLLRGLLAAEKADEDAHVEDLQGLFPGVSDREFHHVLGNLIDGGFAAGKPWHGGGQRYPDYLDLRLSGRGRQAIRDWPTDNLFDALINALDVAIERAEEPSERTRLEKFRASALEVGQGVVTGVLSTVASQIAGLR